MLKEHHRFKRLEIFHHHVHHHQRLIDENCLRTRNNTHTPLCVWDWWVKWRIGGKKYSHASRQERGGRGGKGGSPIAVVAQRRRNRRFEMKTKKGKKLKSKFNVHFVTWFKNENERGNEERKREIKKGGTFYKKSKHPLPSSLIFHLSPPPWTNRTPYRSTS